MIPLFLKLKIGRKEKKDLTLWIPLFLLWILILWFFYLIWPLVLIALVLVLLFDKRKITLTFVLRTLKVLAAIKGTYISVNKKNNKFTLYIF